MKMERKVTIQNNFFLFNPKFVMSKIVSPRRLPKFYHVFEFLPIKMTASYTPSKSEIVRCSLEYWMNFVTLLSSDFKNN